MFNHQRSHRHHRLIESLESRELLASDFTIALLPDTQYYSQSYPEIFQSQTQWLANNIESHNLAFVSQVGDLVQHGASELQWQRADAAMDTLDGDLLANPNGLIPYAVAAGNHDYSSTNSHSDATYYISYFGDARYAGRSWYGGSSPDQLNHYQVFTVDGRHFLHLDVEWEPRDAAIAWAQSVLDAHRYLPTIVTTHSYLRPYDGHFVGAESTDGRDGTQIFADLISPNSQIFLVLSGHVSTEKHQVSLNAAGMKVIEILANYQSRENGGNGWLQLLNFRPDLDRIDVTTYSPWLNEYETDANSQFTIAIDFDARFALDRPPTAYLATPEDNGIVDLNPVAGSIRVEQSPTELVVQLADISPGINDTSVSSSVITLRRNGILLSATTDYMYSYDAQTDRITLTSRSGLFSDGAYRIGISEGVSKVSDRDGRTMAATIIDLVIDTSVPPPAGDFYFSVDAAVTLAGVAFQPSDIVYFDGSRFQVFFDGDDVGLSGRNVDAFTLLSATEILLSLSESASIPGISGTVRDSDIIKFTATQLGDSTSGSFSMWFDGSDVGLDSSTEDIDALTILPNGNLLISTQGVFSAGGVAGDDEDLFEFRPTSLGDNTAGTWSLYFDGSDVGLADEDLSGVQVYPNGQIFFSNTTSFSLAGISGRAEDIFKFVPLTLGSTTSGSFVAPLFFDGSNFGLANNNLTDFYIPIVQRPNRAPIAEDDEIFGNEDVPIAIDVVDDNGNGHDGDSDGTLDLSQISIVAAPEHGTMQYQGNGVFLYTPHANYFGSDSFQYAVFDNRGAVSNVATVSIYLADINDAPIARDDTLATATGVPLVVDLVGDNGAGADFDVEGTLTPSSVEIVTSAAHGTLFDHGDGTITYTPHEGFIGVDTFTYTVKDHDGETSNLATVTISVHGINFPPVAHDDHVATSEDQPVIFDVLADNGHGADGDSDGNLAQGSVVIVTGPAHGILANLGNGQFRYTPQANYFGLDGFTYTVADSIGAVSNVATVTIQIASVNDLPVARNDNVTTTQDAQVTINVLVDNGQGADSDVDGTLVPSSVSIVAGPVHGSLQAQGNGAFVYTPQAGYSGSDSFTYTVTDNEGAVSNLAVVTLTIAPAAIAELYFTVQTNTTLSTGLAVANEDVVAFDGSTFRIVFDGSDVGLSSRALSAFEMLSATEILMSFTSTFSLPGIAETVTPSDIVKFTATSLGESTAGTFAMWFDGSDVGLDTASEEIDAIEVLPDGRILISVNEVFVSQGITFNDEDLIAFTPTSMGSNTAGAFAMYFDGSQVQIGSQDIDGVAIDAAGKLYFSTQGDFSLSGLSIADDDVFTFIPSSIGNVTSGSYGNQLYFDGSSFGLMDNDLRDFDIFIAVPPTNLRTLASPSSNSDLFTTSEPKPASAHQATADSASTSMGVTLPSPSLLASVAQVAPAQSKPSISTRTESVVAAIDNVFLAYESYLLNLDFPDRAQGNFHGEQQENPRVLFWLAQEFHWPNAGELDGDIRM